MDTFGSQIGDPAKVVVAGDVRANENIALTAVQTLFAREHNRIVTELRAFPWLTTEDRFQIARRVVGAELQFITYEEFLPDLGVRLAPYRGYQPGGRRVRHRRLPGSQHDPRRVRADRAGGPLLAEAARRLHQAGDHRGAQHPELCGSPVIQPDCFTDVSDLGAIDAMRGRNHGMPSYNGMRRAYGLPAKSSFTAVTGEATESFPHGLGIDSPRSLDFVDLRDRDGNPVAPGADGAVAARRSTATSTSSTRSSA